MALRHGLPEFRPSLDSPVEEGKVLPRMPKPPAVEFRSGSDMREVVQVVQANKSVHVDAAVGAGKSTVLPYKIAETMQMLVVQVFPNPYLACDVSAYCRGQGRDSYFMEDVMDDMPERGVVCVAASVLVARWLQSGEVVLPRCVVFHDESHESDAYTYLVKNICASLKTVRCYVTATATSVGGGFRQMETNGKIVDHVVPAGVFRSEWDVYSDEPWGVEVLEGHMLVFEESKAKAEDLAQRYRYAGMSVYRFHARMDIGLFRQAMAELRDPSSPLVVIIADYAFRSGFTFPVARIVDTAEVCNVVVERGKPVKKIRNAYEYELYQARGRGARLPGLTTQYYRPEFEAQPYICDLEASEVDAAALVFRLLGYVVPRQLAGATTIDGDVPRNLQMALRGYMPLACLQSSQKLPLSEFFSASGRRSPFLKEEFELNLKPADLLNNSITADTARKYGQGGVRPVVQGVPEVIRRWDSEYDDGHARKDSACDMSSDLRSVAAPQPSNVYKKGEPFDHAGHMRAVADTISAFTAHEDSVDGMEIGHYYYATGLYSSAMTSSAFPEGYISVCRWLSRDHSEARHRGLSDIERSVAVNALLSRYNIRTCEMRVLTYAIPQVKERAVGKDLGAVRKWATDMSEAVVEILADLHVLSKYVLRIVRGFCGLSEMEPQYDLEESGRGRVVHQIDALPSASVGPPSHALDALRKQWGEVEIGKASTITDESSDYGYRELENVPMPTTGKGMRAIAGPATEIRYGKKKGRVEYALRKDGRRLSLIRH